MIDVEFFSSPIGLGHVTRDIAIVNCFENISTNFVTGDVAAKILKNLDFKVEDVYKPPQFIVEDGSLKNSARWLWKYYQYFKDCKKISKKIIESGNPNFSIVFRVDKISNWPSSFCSFFRITTYRRTAPTIPADR